jgi:4-hydroxyphenylpyruvate dioxygenase
LIEPEPDASGEASADGERLQRLALGVPDVPAAVAALRARGVAFVETDSLHSDVRGALTEPQLGGLMFELVQHTQRTP